MEVMTKMIRTYTELSKLKTFEERFRYLKLHGSVGQDTFGHDRHLNQMLYRSRQWKEARDYVIIRDAGCDLGIEGMDIHHRLTVHHMNPIDLEDIENDEDYIYDPEYLISVSHNTHLAIHFGDESLLPKDPIERRPGDTTPWR